MVMPLLRTSFLLLLLVPLPYPNLPAAIRRAARRARAAATALTSTAAARRQRRFKHSSNSSESALLRKEYSGSAGSSSAGNSCKAPAASGCAHGNRSSNSFIAWYQPSCYWQYPALRYGVIIMQRILPLVAAGSGVGNNPYFEFTLSVFCWRMLRKYVYDGWMQYMLVVSAYVLCMAMIDSPCSCCMLPQLQPAQHAAAMQQLLHSSAVATLLMCPPAGAPTCLACLIAVLPSLPCSSPLDNSTANLARQQ